jgi:hypothetical protein
MMRELQGLLPVTREEADRAGRERAHHDLATHVLKTAARVSAHRSMEKRALVGPIGTIGGAALGAMSAPKDPVTGKRKGVLGRALVGSAVGTVAGGVASKYLAKHAAEGDIGAILSGAIANKFGTQAALKELAETEDSKREPAVTDPQEALPQIPSGRGISSNIQPGQLLQAGTTIDEFRRQEGLAKHALSLAPITGFFGRVGQAVAGAGRRASRLFARGERKAVGQLATAEQAARIRPVGPPPIPADAPAGDHMKQLLANLERKQRAKLPVGTGGASAAPGHVPPHGAAPGAPGGAGGPYRTPGTPAPERAPGKLSRKATKATEIEGLQAGKVHKGPSLMGGLATMGILGGTAYGLAKGVPAAVRTMEQATANPMAYGMGYRNLPLGAYDTQDYTSF